MRRVKAKFGRSTLERVQRVLNVDQLAAEWLPDQWFLVKACSEEERIHVEKLQESGLANVDWVISELLESGDVVVPLRVQNVAMVLYRLSDKHHGIQLTNRCNSYCLMCSQPPTKKNDEWMVQDAIDVIRHIGISPPVMGLSGGEPTLLGRGLRTVLDSIQACHPTTHVEILTNGRLLADSELARRLVEGLDTKVSWLVPLYGHADFLHDFVVQAQGAYEETIAGILNLQMLQQPIQLRIVLIKPVLEVLPEVCTFIGRNLPFVREVALMACEPIGFALANRDLCEVDLIDWQDALLAASRQLLRYEIPFLFMNTPLCMLPESLHRYAHQSISDWKNVFAPECNSCQLQSGCSGFFAWYEKGWKPSKVINQVGEKAL